jgi:hypothetical protein
MAQSHSLVPLVATGGSGSCRGAFVAAGAPVFA